MVKPCGYQKMCIRDRVGTGKTLIMCIAAHEMKRLNLAHKPMIIGLKANVAEIAATYHCLLYTSSGRKRDAPCPMMK